MTLAGLLNLGIILVGLAIVVLGLLLYRGRKRSAQPTCPKCGYALSGLPGIEREGEAYEPVACPECGHAAARRITLFRRRRRPAWLALVALGIAVLCEPLYLGYAYDVYDHLPDSAIVHLYSEWDDHYAGWVVQGRIGVPSTAGTRHYSAAQTRTLAEGAIRRIERANAHGQADRVDPLDVRILSLYDNTSTDAAFSARVAAAMPPLFSHPDDRAHFTAGYLARDRHDPGSSVAVALNAKASSDPRVRAAASVCLFVLAWDETAMAGEFVQLLEDPDEVVRGMASVQLFRHATRARLPAAFGPPLRAINPPSIGGRRARWVGLMAALQGPDRQEALVEVLREANDDIRWEALEIISNDAALTAALLPQWGQDRQAPIGTWLQGQRHRPIDEVLEELGFQ